MKLADWPTIRPDRQALPFGETDWYRQPPDEHRSSCLILPAAMPLSLLRARSVAGRMIRAAAVCVDTPKPQAGQFKHSDLVLWHYRISAFAA
jgi:hypothetical protein